MYNFETYAVQFQDLDFRGARLSLLGIGFALAFRIF